MGVLSSATNREPACKFSPVSRSFGEMSAVATAPGSVLTQIKTSERTQ